MVSMYTEIPISHVRDAVVYALSKVQEGRRSRRPISWFAISKNTKAEDGPGSAASSYFVDIPLHLVLDYIDYELSRNGLFSVGAWVLNQVWGLPMGGVTSAQLACIYIAVRETKNTAVAFFTPQILACRYRNNIYSFGRESLLLQRLPEFQHLSSRITACLSSLSRWARASTSLRCPCACTAK